MNYVINSSMDYSRNGFLRESPWSAVPCIVILSIATAAGTFGNVIILVINFQERFRCSGKVFMVNLALSDLYVTVVADTMSIVAKLEGEQFFESIPGLCQTIASICTISCVTSMMTIAAMSINRYFYICRNDMYRTIFTKRNSILICVSLYGIGTVLVLLNTIGIGDHSFDKKSLECIWDRMATFPYTVAFSVCLVWIPSIITGVCFLKIYLYVRNHRRKIIQQQTMVQKFDGRSVRLAKTLFFVYAVFVICWAPYALLIAIDYNDEYPHELHVYITMFAHLHPSLNWLIHYRTNKNFADAFKQIISRCVKCNSFEGFVPNTSVQVRDEAVELRDSIKECSTSHETRVSQTQLCEDRPKEATQFQLPGSVLPAVQSESEI